MNTDAPFSSLPVVHRDSLAGWVSHNPPLELTRTGTLDKEIQKINTKFTELLGASNWGKIPPLQFGLAVL